ncbi:MAG: metal ABC transporter permease [Neomegalonema sp.]|nr:metal ABC transporter permease [Neomegalonema sp.]
MTPQDTLSLQEFLQIDFPSILLAALAGVTCALLGNFLILRRQALIGDAISHVVLPGIVVGFLLTGSTDSLPMFLGALAAAVIAVLAIEGINRLSGVGREAAMGVVFTAMFAAGVLLLEQSGAGAVHLDVEHALLGNLESALWLEADGAASLLDPQALAALPDAAGRLAVVLGIVGLFVGLLWKELRMVSFDPGFANNLGVPAWALGFGLSVMTAIAAVAAFEAVGSILVIAMFICPAATARLLTDRLSVQIWISVAVALLAAVAGYLLAAFGLASFGLNADLSAAGMVALTAGLAQAAAMIVKRRRLGSA